MTYLKKYQYLIIGVIVLILGNSICYIINDRLLSTVTNGLVVFSVIVNTVIDKKK